jgi:hypothetical protein
VPAWLGLAELYNDQGQKMQAGEVLQYADSLTEGLKRWRWDMALTAYQLNRQEMLPGELSFIIRELPGKTRNDALQMAFLLWDDPEALMTNVGRDNVIHLFNHSVQNKLPDMALAFWKVIEAEGWKWQENEALALIDMLIATENIPEATTIWRKHFNPENIFYNGDFKRPFMLRAFGWRVASDKDFVQQIERNETGVSMHYRFKGWDNLNFYHLSQIVPVAGGRMYELHFEAETKMLTTDQRPFLEVYGYKCGGLQANSDMFPPNQEMAPYVFSFGVPEECDAVVVRLRRNESRQIDNKLSGRMWLRNLKITDTGEDFPILDTGR